MAIIYYLQFLLFSVCVHLFTLFTFYVYYSDKFYLDDVVIQKEYDYVIVGSGTAGSLIAHRLSTETNYSFIVLEAGGRGHPLLEIPVLGPFLHRSVFDWKFETVPQKHACFAMEGNKCRMPQGKIVGGSSKLNNMVHIRGNISHYVEWFYGKYNHEYITKQFEYIENNILHINKIQYQSELSDAVLEAAKELGYNIIDKEFKQGFMKTLLSQRNGKRWSTSDNLKNNIIPHAVVENILFNGNTAVGVNAAISNKNYHIYGRKGVILSAGAINSPKILQLSGIGPENILRPLNITVLKRLPVGENLQDHVGTGLDLVLFNKPVSIGSFDMINPLNALKYFIEGKGPLTTPGCEAMGFISTKNDTIPDLQYMVLPVGISEDRGSLFSKNLGIKNEVFEKYFAKSFYKYAATFLPLVLHPKSRGNVYINSKDPNKPPVFNPNYLTHKEDVQILVVGLKILIEILNTNTMKKLGAELNRLHFPGCEKHELFSDSYFECYVKHLTLTSYHPAGTCSMGLSESKTSVVDLDFKVIGVRRLYVVDASVLPTLPSGNINAAIAMMANIFFDNLMSKIDNNLYCYNDNFVNNLFSNCNMR